MFGANKAIARLEKELCGLTFCSDAFTTEGNVRYLQIVLRVASVPHVTDNSIQSCLADSAEILCAHPNRRYVLHGTLMLH
jgi:hypothetical protein